MGDGRWEKLRQRSEIRSQKSERTDGGETVLLLNDETLRMRSHYRQLVHFLGDCGGAGAAVE